MASAVMEVSCHGGGLSAGLRLTIRAIQSQPSHQYHSPQGILRKYGYYFFAKTDYLITFTPIPLNI